MSHEQHDNEAEKFIVDTIAKYGWQISTIESDGYSPSFAYTIGLTKTYNHPELIILGLSTKLMGELLNIAGALIKNGHNITLNKEYDDFLNGYNCKFIKIHKDYYSDYLGYGIWFNNGKDFEAYQLVWPNKNGDFPWNKGDDEDLDIRQPILDRNMNFKFLEKENLAIYTTKYIIELEKPILYVYHEQNGDWQFVCGTTDNNEDVKIACLKDIIEIDNSLNELFNLGLGEYAYRKSINDKWQRDKIET
jgi:hypothetical protein